MEFHKGATDRHCDASYLDPYEGNTAYVGATMLSVEKLRDLLLELSEEKLDLLVHTIGGLAVRTVLDAVEAAQAIAKDEFYPRVTIAHLVEIDPVDLPRIEELGSIEKGKLADFVILNKNLFEVDPYEISKLKPSAVVMEGKVIQGSFPE